MLRARSLLALAAATALAVAAAPLSAPDPVEVPGRVLVDPGEGDTFDDDAYEVTFADASGPVLVTGRDRWGNTTPET